jgi:septal ring factor EnvC (AmiA/AmiB activator)
MPFSLGRTAVTTAYDADLDVDDTGEGQDDQQQPQNSAFKQLRAHARKLEKDLKDRDKELEDLRTFRQNLEKEQREGNAKSKFKALGLAEKQADLFLTKNPEGDVTDDAVRTFAVEYGLITPSEDGSDDQSGFTPAPADGSPAGSKQLTNEEFWTLYGENPSAALEAAKKGRVSFDSKL